MSTFKPTRSCPHRLCRPMHLALAGLGVVVVVQLMFHGIASVLFVAALMVLGFGALRLLSGKTLTEEILEEAAEVAAGVELIVRPVWAAIAVGFDVLYVCSAALLIGMLFTQPTESMVPGASTGAFIVVGVSVGLQVFAQFAHRQATRPAKRKRALVPVVGGAA